MQVSQAHTALKRGVFTWKDLSWIRELWRGPIVIKGVLTADDARRSLDHGAAAMVLYLITQRRGTAARRRRLVRPLPEVVAAVKDQAEIIRWTAAFAAVADVVKALCMGARAVLCGRAYAYGLATSGEAGVARALEILREDIERSLKPCWDANRWPP